MHLDYFIYTKNKCVIYLHFQSLYAKIISIYSLLYFDVWIVKVNECISKLLFQRQFFFQKESWIVTSNYTVQILNVIRKNKIRLDFY